MAQIYDYTGNVILKTDEKGSRFNENMSVRYFRDTTANTSYYVTQIFKQKTDGTKQYPFVRIMQTTAERKTAYDLAVAEGWDFTINGGGWEGPAIENHIAVRDADPYYQTGGYIITVDQNGDLGYKGNVAAGDGATLVQQGIVSAFYAFFPLVVNYEAFDYPTDIKDTFGNHNWEIAQKQIFGQFANGDYCLITSEGRSFANSVGFTVPQIQTMCLNLGLKFAFHLDGGGSTQTVYGKKRINCVYEAQTRVLPGFIVFNSSDHYYIPNAQ